jgi:ubiquinone/menaquinone biosynthesis C-methylase UbiE
MKKYTRQSARFYDSLASYYDDMISFNQALSKRTTHLSSFVNPAVMAADFGCGTGLDSVAMAMLGAKVSAFDYSEDMLKQAKKNSRKYNQKIDFYNSSIDKIPKNFHNKFDLIISLGNTLANLDTSQLRKTFRKAADMLKAKGVFVLQILNYERIINSAERIVKITDENNIFIVRFYDFLSTGARFNILRFSGNKPHEYSLITTKIFMHSLRQLKQCLENSGFYKIKTFGNLDMEKFQNKTSHDLVIIAEKKINNR